MITKILVPTDFSETDRQALNYAIALAKKTNSALEVFHVKHPIIVDANMPVMTYQTFAEEEEKNMQDNFRKLQNGILKDSGLKYSFASTTGFASDDICRRASDENFDLVLMGTKGRHEFDDILIGSTTASVVSKSNVPVFVIPMNCKMEPFQKIVYATDYNESEFPQMSKIVYLADLYNASIDVLHIKSDNDNYFDSEHNFFSRNKKNIDYPKVTYHTLHKGDLISCINSYCEINKSDLLVLAKHNRNFFDRLFHRSISKRMVYHTHIPLMVLVK